MNILRNIICLCALCLSSLFTTAQITKTPPRLTVIISINGLDNYEIETFSKMLDPNGMRKLISGVYNPNATCSYMVTSTTTDYASMMTGSTPHYHGIIANKFYSLIDNNIVSNLITYYQTKDNVYSHKKYSASDIIKSYRAIKSGKKPLLDASIFDSKIIFMHRDYSF